jgi:hypothetical protein
VAVAAAAGVVPAPFPAADGGCCGGCVLTGCACADGCCGLCCCWCWWRLLLWLPVLGLVRWSWCWCGWPVESMRMSRCFLAGPVWCRRTGARTAAQTTICGTPGDGALHYV